MSRLPNVLLAELKPGRIQTGLQVKHIEQQNGTLNVCGTYADGRPFSRQAQHVLLALPLCWLQGSIFSRATHDVIARMA